MATLALDANMSMQTWHSEPANHMQTLKRQSFGLGSFGLCKRPHILDDATLQQDIPQTRQPTRPAVAVRSVQGRRPYQEDSFSVVTDLLGGSEAERGSDATSPAAARNDTLSAGAQLTPPMLHYAAVFDGHGGHAVSQHCSEHMAPILRSRVLRSLRKAGHLRSDSSSSDGLTDEQLFAAAPQSDLSEQDSQLDQSQPALEPAQVPIAASEQALISDALQQAFIDCDACIPERAAADGGSTAVCALISADRIWAANAGDSRAVVARRGAVAVPLTDDHKPERPDEAERIKAAGGHVFWNGGHRVMGVLSMSRAMGDHYLKQFGVIPTPEIKSVERTPDDEFLLLASDGLWMSLTNVEAVGVASACVERAQVRGADRQAALRVAAQVLVKAALQQGSSDNITVVLVDLLQGPQAMQPPAQAVAVSAAASSHAPMPTHQCNESALDMSSLRKDVAPLAPISENTSGMRTPVYPPPPLDLLQCTANQAQDEQGPSSGVDSDASTPHYPAGLVAAAATAAAAAGQGTEPQAVCSHVTTGSSSPNSALGSASFCVPLELPLALDISSLASVCSAPEAFGNLDSPFTSIPPELAMKQVSPPLSLFDLLQLSNSRFQPQPLQQQPAESSQTHPRSFDVCPRLPSIGKRNCSDTSDDDEYGPEQASPTKRSRGPSASEVPAPLLDEVTERLLVAVPPQHF